MKILVALLFFLPTTPTHASEAICLRTGTTCSDVDIDSVSAEASYRKGCDGGEAYACSRLGQFFEVKRLDREQALAAYERGCKGKDAFGCEEAGQLRPRLCFVEGKKKFCDGKEPTGEFRALLFLRTLDAKYANAFRGHNFDRGWSIKEAEELFRQRVKEKNTKLLRALEKEEKLGYHDGGDGEGLSYEIQCIKKTCPGEL